MEDIAAKKGCEKGHAHSTDSGEISAIGNIAAQLGKVSFAEFLGNGDHEAVADANAKAQHHKTDGACGTDARQSVDAQILSDDHGVHHII